MITYYLLFFLILVGLVALLVFVDEKLSGKFRKIVMTSMIPLIFIYMVIGMYFPEWHYIWDTEIVSTSEFSVYENDGQCYAIKPDNWNPASVFRKIPLEDDAVQLLMEYHEAIEDLTSKQEELVANILN